MITDAPPGPAPEPAAVRARFIVFSVVTLAGMASAVIFRQSRAELPNPALITFTLLSWLPLLGRVRWPGPTLIAVLAVECTHVVFLAAPAAGTTTSALMGFYQPVPLATMVAAFSVAYRLPGRAGWLAGAGAAVMLPLVGMATQPLTLLATDMVMFNLVAGAVLTGWAMAERSKHKAREAAQRRAETRRYVVAERVRIARELHDSLAHNLTLVNAQIGVANHLVRTNPEAAALALQGITQHTRQALDELRATVGLLRQDDDPTPQPPTDGPTNGPTDGPTNGPTDGPTDGPTNPVPGLDRLDDLLAGFRAAGTAVALAVTGTAVRPTSAVNLAAYRIVQEALTNATKHAAGASVRVTLDWLPQRLEIGVVNDPPAGRHRRGLGTGHGLIGMRERVHHAGGTLQTGRTAQGGFAVTATLPIVQDLQTESRFPG